jgi:AraC-like DNA-binding protein
MDLLSEALESLSPSGQIRQRLELSAPWGFDGPSTPGTFYAVVRGLCWLERNEGEAVQLAAGDFAILPRGAAHLVRDSRATRAVPFNELNPDAGGGAVTTLVSGSVSYGLEDESPLIASLPSLMRLQSDGSEQSFEEALRLFLLTLAAARPGADAIACRLAVVLMVAAIRAEMAKATDGWLRAMAHPQVGAAIALMHAEPGEDWTIESLAKRVGMSRAAFAVRFHEVAGEPPLTYLTRWRMSAAARQLRATDRPIAEIAAAASYESEAAFNNVFKRIMGITPGRYRRGQNPQPPPKHRRRQAAVVTPRKPQTHREQPEKKRDWSFID